MKKQKTVNLFLLLLSLLLASLSCRQGSSDTGTANIDNGLISIAFNDRNGSLVNFSDISGKHEWIDDDVAAGSPWELYFTEASGIEPINAADAGKFRFSKPDSRTLILKWKRFGNPGIRNLEVEARVSLDSDKALSYWNISVRNPDRKQIRQLNYPKLAGLREAGEEYLAVPQWMGQITKNPRESLAPGVSAAGRYEWTYPGLSLQCLALYSPGRSGLYIACNDTLAYIKNFSFTLDSLNTLTYRMHNFPSIDPSSASYTIPYSAVVGSFRGDWITAAEIYREWASGQRWARESRFLKGLTPEWLEKTALWVWNRSKSDNVLVPAADIRQRLGLPVSVFWHWWHGCSYDDGFPEYLPPREGRKSFLSAMDEAHKKGIRSIVYMNQRLWGTETESWEKENAAEYSVKNSDGSMNTHVYNIFSGKGTASMCLGTAFWKDRYASLCDSVVNSYTADGVYMDQACLALPCYDPGHDHPTGPGNYWVENFGRLTDQIRSKVAGEKQMILAGEGCGEAWLPHLDLMLTLAVSKERYAGLNQWETIPFFQAVYHQYSITYGNYSSLLVPPYDELWPEEYAPEDPLEMLDRKFSRQFLMEQARSFVWGMQPTIANYHARLASHRKEEIDFLLRLSRIRNNNLKYLLHGKFMRSPDIGSPSEEIDISRLSIYAGKTGNTVSAFRGTFPLVYSGAWKADDGDLGIALASTGDRPVSLSFGFDAGEYGLPAAGRIFLADDRGRRELTAYTDSRAEISLTLAPAAVCVLEVIPDHGSSSGNEMQ
ncbi:MAG TPA: DUF6259 domain-containing protein [Bacteroidales bacterium]|jgi:hypothetical protein|nr:DUF6259 domain-containing protein [Bacteroidales bacterium]HOS71249.1 DUF6259 domain-containing protein [Bacteroidales bacterium]HQH24096.1 DUF6259 domain-containing protein [Bacteroidales bacterium]HQJ83440.1 DUF6259 domain-containing protein [Bacteroidales bacterium]